ncbi:retrotransposon protein, putative, ty1-copia subclass [Tanacetum coccineum]
MRKVFQRRLKLPVLAIREGRILKDKKKPRGAKGKDKGKNNLAYVPKPMISPPPKKDNSAKDYVCHHCKEVGHWRRNCPSYQAELKKKKNASVTSTSESRKLKHGALSLYMGNGMRAAVEGIGSFDLILPRGLIIGWYYEIDMHNLYPNVSSMFNVSNKRAKHALDSSYLWHCCLGHINKKCIDKLHHDESLEKCKSCISGKMARKPFPYQVKRAKDLLGLIHTDVCALLELCQERVLVTSSPLQMISAVMHGKDPKLSYLKVWGCEALMKQDAPDKLDPRSIKCIFVGYPKETMGYYFYYLLENNIFVARNAEFFENSLMVQEASVSHGLLESSGSDRGLELIQEEDTQPSKNTNELHDEVTPIEVEPQNVEVPIRRSARIPQAPDIYGFYVDVEEYELEDLNEPPNYKDALSDPKFDKWLEAINTEMQSMKDNQQNPGEIHWTAAKAILKYLRNTKYMVLVYRAKPEAELKSTTAMSSTKAEYITAEASMEADWMRKFINGLGGVVPSNKRPMEMLCDNEPAIAIANDPKILKGARHF